MRRLVAKVKNGHSLLNGSVNKRKLSPSLNGESCVTYLEVAITSRYVTLQFFGYFGPSNVQIFVLFLLCLQRACLN